MVRRLIIREVAQIKGISTMAGLQRSANLDRNTAQRVWRNKLYNARPATLEKIARALNVTLEELWMEDGRNIQQEDEDEIKEHIPFRPEVSADFAPTLIREEAARKTRILKALAEPTRLQILNQLSRFERKMSVNELVSAYNLSQPAISSHLRVLENAGLISCYKDEQWNYYYINYNVLHGIADFLIHTLIYLEKK